MGKNLLIVESPAKAKTIEKYLGKDFTVKASYGHVRDLPTEEEAIDVENGFEPKYVIIPDKKQVINELKKLMKDHDQVWLATDEDREGEAISWHLASALELDLKLTQRIVFNEITKTAITRAIENPRPIDEKLVNAQQARRVLDRLVGFRLSPVLWRKIRGGLSAGRVQSVAVRLIVEREREITDFTAESAFRVQAEFLLDNGAKVKAELPSRFSSAGDAREFLESCLGADYTIVKLETKPAKKSPTAPFTTSTLQQEASRKLGFSVSRTMRVAQGLYESGFITYMRTDSVNLSDFALEQAETVIRTQFGDKYHKKRQYKNKNTSAQEAHEAIRPTELGMQDIEEGDRDAKRLYELIWRRTLASQMADAQLEKTVVDIEISTNQIILKATGEVLKFDGFLKLYLESRDDEPEDEADGVLPPLEIGQVLDLQELMATERFSRPAARFTEASLVKKLEELGIGRPSTYAPTISTIQKREYTVKESRQGLEREYRKLTLSQDQITEVTLTEVTGAEKNKLFPTDLGMVTTDFLVKFFPSVLDYSFTAKVEAEFDEIAEGKKEWREMIATFYQKFAPQVEKTKEQAGRGLEERVLGKHPVNGRDVLVRFGKFGPMVQVGRPDEEDKPVYAKLRGEQRLETISMEEALDLFRLPRTLGEFEEETVKTNIGRYGPYVQLGKSFVSLEEEDDPYDITLERAIELILKKREADANRVIKQFSEEVQVLNGRWGPYIRIHGKNVKIPKGTEPQSLTLEDCEELAKNSKSKPAKGRRKK
jgi:DNA topoisomerase-1